MAKGALVSDAGSGIGCAARGDRALQVMQPLALVYTAGPPLDAKLQFLATLAPIGRG